MLCDFVLFSLFHLYCMSAIIHTQLWAASIDGLRPTWQHAIIHTLLSTICLFLQIEIQ